MHVTAKYALGDYQRQELFKNLGKINTRGVYQAMNVVSKTCNMFYNALLTTFYCSILYHAFCHPLLFKNLLNIFKKSCMNTIRVSVSLGPDQVRRFWA